MEKEKSGTVVKEPKTPECEKMAACREDSQKLGQFIEWLREEWAPAEAERVGGDWSEIGFNDIHIENTLAQYFEIDLNKVENERRELLLYCRLNNAEREQRKELLIEEKVPPTTDELKEALTGVMQQFTEKPCHDPAKSTCPFCQAAKLLKRTT